MRWLYTPLPESDVRALAERVNLSRPMAELLLRRGLTQPEAIARFLNPSLQELEDPFLLANLEAAAARLRRAIDRRESVVVLGDYDVDGVSSTAFLVDILRRLGLSPRFIVPRRMEDGYGLSRSAIDRALEGGRPDLFIALDCGTNSRAETAYLRDQGVDVLVVDHHRSKEGGLVDALLVNPHVGAEGDSGVCRDFCTVGLVFKLVHGLLKQLRAEKYPDIDRIRLKDYLDLVAMGTVADLVPLLGENRILARHGLRMLRGTQRRGLHALMNVAGINRQGDILPVDISFRLGPRINASGRLADAALSVDLILSQDDQFCFEAARQLDGFNRERQEIERQITETAERLVEERYAQSAGIVLYDDAWHPGVVGIVAGRVCRNTQRPCIVLGNEGELAKGSGRSVFGLNLVEILAECSEYLEAWGGHPMAVGVSLRKERIEGFREAFAAAVGERLCATNPEPELQLSGWLEPQEIHERFLEELCSLHPFGQGNPEPVFGVRGAVLLGPPDVFKEHHFRFQIGGGHGRRLYGVAWKLAQRLPPVGQPIDLAVQLAWNQFNGKKLLQLELLDWRRSVGK